MHLHFERTSSSRTDCTVLSLTWMGKVPDELPEEVHGWKLNRVNYYQDGWLATGNTRGIVGVTFTTCHCRKTADLPHRTNYNLRGHRSEVTLVKWNEPYQKLASCDSSGIIFVWIKYEGRWSIELINDRNTQVTDFSWSHDGRMALICYLDGFVLVGSVAGQRYWSSMLNLEATITCGIWTPDDQQVFFGTSNGQILVIDVHGAMVAQVSVLEDVTICAMAWSCEKFKMEETDEDEGMTPLRQPKESKPSVLAVCFQNGAIYIMKNYDDVSPVIVDTGLRGIQMEWSNSGELLAVAGVSADSKPSFFENFVHFYTEMGVLRFVIPLSCSESPVTALTWGHNDKRLFVATGCVIHIGWVTRRVASLQLLSRLAIHRCLQDENCVQRLPLPRRLRGLITNLFGQTIRCCLPDPQHLREFVSSPPANNIRLHCTMIRHDDDVVTGSATYTLYLEYLGGLVPLLKGKRASKIRPEFVIFDPQYPDSGDKMKILKPVTFHSQSSPIVYSHSYTGSPIPPPQSPVFPETSSDSEVEEGCASPRLQRRRRNRRQAHRDLENGGVIRKELVYLDELPEHEKLVSITSNIWGTKFKLVGLVPWLPTHLGAITYRTSLLHLQPRQMTLVIKELRGPQAPECHSQGLSHGSIASSSSGLISSDDDDDFFEPNLTSSDECAPVAPMTPRKHLRCSGQTCAAHHPQPVLSNSDMERIQANGSSDYVNFIPNDEFLTIETAAGDKMPIVTFDNSGDVTGTVNIRQEVDSSSLMSVATQTSFHSISELHQSARRGQASEAMSSACEHCKCCCRDAHRVKLEGSNASKSEIVTPGISAASSEDQLATDATHQSDSIASDVQIMVNGIDQASSESFEDDPRSSISLDLRPVCSGIDSSSEGSVFANADEALFRTKIEDEMVARPPETLLDEVKSQEAEARINAYNNASRLHTFQNELETINRKVWHKSRQSSPGVPSSSPSLHPNCGSPVWEPLPTVNRNGDSDMVSASVHVQPNVPNNHNAIGDLPRWADKADLKFIDEDGDEPAAPEITVMGCQQYTSGSSVVFCSNRGKGINHVQTNEFMSIMDMRPVMPGKDTNRRLTLKGRQPSDTRGRSSGSSCLDRTAERKHHLGQLSDEHCTSHGSIDCGSVGSDDPSCFCDVDSDATGIVSHSLTSLHRSTSKKAARPREEPFSSCPNITVDNKVSSIRRTDRLYVESPLISRSANSSPCGRNQRDSVGEGLDIPSPIHLKNHRGSLPQTDNLLDGSGPSSPTSRSIPSSPVVQRKRQQQRKGLLYSPLLLRKVMRQRLVESSDEEGMQSGEDIHMEDFKDLESFQKAYIRKKMKKRRGRVQPDNLEARHPTPSYRELILHNKAPLWNEVSQVYQLDFGGRVTQESAKNFQIEFRGKQVMQFGRIDGNAYTLDFQYPFCALQAFAVALANVTQRLK